MAPAILAPELVDAIRKLAWPPRLVGYWRCCQCDRELKKALHGEERCPDCAHIKCIYCTDPLDRPSSLTDVVGQLVDSVASTLQLSLDVVGDSEVTAHKN
jgi:hypothetical protein